MPVKGSTLAYGNRDYIYNKQMWNDLKKDPKFQLSHETCRQVIENCNRNIADVLRDETDGFKLPFGLGYLCSIKFIPKKDKIDWVATKKNGGKHVLFTNMHTFGYAVGVRWFRVGRVDNVAFNQVFKFKACKSLSTIISKAFKSGKAYLALTNADFIEKSRLENLYNKKYRKELKDK